MVMPEPWPLFFKKQLKRTFCLFGDVLLLSSFKLRVVLEKGYLSSAPFSASHASGQTLFSFTETFQLCSPAVQIKFNLNISN